MYDDGKWYQSNEGWQQLSAYNLMELMSEEMKEANDSKGTIILEFVEQDIDIE